MKAKHKEQELLEMADNLTREIELIRAKIEEIKREGEVAEPGYTLMRYLAGGKQKKYWYYKLHASSPIFPTKSGKLSKYKHLGKGGSNAHIEALMQICRRNQIEALSMTLDYLYKGFADLKESTSKSEKSDSEN
jgi:hypothetical protein